LVKLSEKNLQ
jgi:hypothetical protein